MLGLVLAVFDGVMAGPLIASVVRGRPETRAAVSERFSAAFNALESDWVRDNEFLASRWSRLSLLLVFGSAVVAAGVAGTPIAALAAAAGAAAWLTVLAASLRTHSASGRRAFARSDAAALQIHGDPAGLADALSAMAAWRSSTRAALPVSTRIMLRLLQPIRPTWHYSERAAAFSRLGPGNRSQ